MDDLPLELLSMIIEQLWEDSPDPPDRGPRLTHPKARTKDKLLINLRSIRLVCKSFRHAAANLFGETFFQVRWVSLSQSSLLDLIAVSETPQYARHVHSLRISAIDFDPQLDKQGEGMRMLAKAFKNFESSLKSILLSLKCSERSRDCQDEMRIIDTVRSALFRSNVQLSRLRIYTNRPGALALASPQLRNFHSVSMQNLTCLKLDFLNDTTVDAEIHETLSRGTVARFVIAMPQLQRLSIYFANEIWYRTPLKKLLGDTVITNLKSIRMCGFNCRESELTDFLLLHRHTLESLEFADFKLRNGKWRNIFKTIREEMSLEMLLFRRVWDREEVFSLSDEWFQGFTRVEFDVVDWDILATSREESDLDLEPVELGETGMFISFPEDLLYDADDADDEDVVNPIPYFAHELLHPGHPRCEGDDHSFEDGTMDSSTSSEVSGATGGKTEDPTTPDSSSVIALEEVEVRSAGLVEPSQR